MFSSSTVSEIWVFTVTHSSFGIFAKSSANSKRKPYTAITVHIERLTGPEHQENDYSGIVDLIEVIRIQDTGPIEAARAIRKKLKYGNAHRQLRSLTILDGLIQNAGNNFQRTFADEPLLDRLRQMPRDDMIDQEVRNKCNLLFRQWAAAYQGTPGLTGIAQLVKQLPSRRRPTASQSKVLAETEREAQQDNPFAEPAVKPPSPSNSRRPSYNPSSPSSANASMTRGRVSSSSNIFSSMKSSDKKTKHRVFNLEKEKSHILQAIAASSVASTSLLNALKFINRETHRVSEDREVLEHFETCKMLRRQILRYIQLVESDQWIGSLLSANDELIKALMAYEIMDKSIDDDSDSENEAADEVQRALNGSATVAGSSIGLGSEVDRSRKGSAAYGNDVKGLRIEDQMNGMSLAQAPAKPPRPGESALRKTSLSAAPPPRLEEDDDDDDDDGDPFGDQNAIRT